MRTLESIILFVTNWVDVLTSIIQTRMMSSLEKDLEIAALRSQLALYHQQILYHKMKKPTPTPVFRQLWVLLSKYFLGWKFCLILVRPETVIGWQRQAFRWYWLKKTKNRADPSYSPATIALIKRIHRENPIGFLKGTEALVSITRTCLKDCASDTLPTCCYYRRLSLFNKLLSSYDKLIIGGFANAGYYFYMICSTFHSMMSLTNKVAELKCGNPQN
jgi:hypothetical protein